MQKKEEISDETKGQDSLRHKMLTLFTTSVSYDGPSLSILEMVLQIFNYIQLLKFSVDYFGSNWFTSPTPVFLYLDPAFYSTFLTSASIVSLLLVGIIIMNTYWILHVFIFLMGIEYSPLMTLIRKIIFLLVRHLLFLPSFSILLGMYSCIANSDYRPCLSQIPIIYQIGYIASFLFFGCFLGFQTFFNFQFLPHSKQYTRLKKSSHTALAFFIYFMVNEIAVFAYSSTGQLAILNIVTICLLGLVLWKEEQIDEIPRLIELSGLGASLLGLVILDLMTLLGYQVQLWVFLILVIGLAGGIMQMRTYSLKFQLENINKWPTPDIMMRYASTIRYYLSRGKEVMFKIYMHGYMEIHRQKCDNIACPSRCALSDYDKHILDDMGNISQNQQLLRINNIIKVIYTAGYKLNPIPAELQLENCIYLHERKETELALRRLLQIQYEELTYDKYHTYCLLKKLLEENILNNKSQQFLDLVTQRNLKKKEEEITKLFEKAALLNLQFWSLLNDDHPDFQKLNQIGVERVRVGAQVQKQFQIISGWAHSERIVTLYANYLQCLQNDQNIVMDIYKSLIERYKLKEKVVVQDWNNSSTNTLLVSLQQASFGKIIDLNTCCATLFGYQRHQLLNQSISILYPDQINSHVKNLLMVETNDMHFCLLHKNGYLIRLMKKSKNYNSMQNGLTALLTIIQEISPYSCNFIVDKSNKIIASNASLLSLLNIDLKSLQGQAYVSLFFNFSYANLPKPNETYSLHHLLKSQFIEKEKLSNESYQLIHEERYGCKFIQIKRLPHIAKSGRLAPSRGRGFQFQVEATLSSVRYIGSVDNEESFVSQFSMQASHELKDSNLRGSFGEGISTLRLRDNVVQLIQQADKIQSQQFIRRDSSVVGSLQVIPRQDEEQIFQSKQSYKQFLKSYNIGGNILWVLGAAAGFVILLYIVTFVVENNNNNSLLTYSQEIIYQNLIIGCIAKQSVFVVEMQLFAMNQSSDTPARLLASYQDNLAFLEQLQLLGSTPFSITINVSGQPQVVSTNQYISTMINYANVLSQNLANAQTNQSFSAAFNSTDPYTIQYLLTGQTVKDTLMEAFISRQAEISSIISSNQSLQAALMSIGVILTVAMGIVLVLWFHNLNKQKIKVLQIFLQISEAQIQRFSNITQRFLVSIHSDQNTELQEDMDSVRKIHSSSFPKKKSFKLIQFSKFLYVKLAFIPALMTAFFFHAYSISYSSTAFQATSVNYFALASQADYYISIGSFLLSAGQVSNASMVMTTVSQPIRHYYRSFLDLDQNSFGTIANYHNTSDPILFQDICSGSQTPYGFVSIPESCELPVLYPNGTFLVLDNFLKQIYFWNQNDPLTYEFHVKMQVLAKAQRLLAQKLIIAEQQVINNTSSSLLKVLLIWLSVVLICTVGLWVTVVTQFTRQLNQVKQILGILPLSIVKEIPKASRYINFILKKNQTC